MEPKGWTWCGFAWVGNGRRYNIEPYLTSGGVSLRFQVTGYVQLVGGELTWGEGSHLKVAGALVRNFELKS